MASLALEKGWYLLVCLFCFSFIICGVKCNITTVEGTVVINGSSPIAHTDENFICATLDLWPPDKCDFGTCSWGNSSLLNLDLNNGVLLSAIKAFSPLKIRLGGILQDKLVYQTEDNPQPCTPFALNTSELFNYTQGCLPLARWDQINSFFNKSGALITFGLNALNGKIIQPNNTAIGPWNYTNAASLIRYSVKKGYNVYGWELGNELAGIPIGVLIPADAYASDTIALHALIHDIYKGGVYPKPLIMAPGGIFEPNWFKTYINKTAGSLNVITHHLYNIGSGVDENLIERILNVSVLDAGADVLKNLSKILKKSATSTVAWVGESGGVYNSGRDGVSNAFVFSFWYLDELGMASIYDTKTYCRQTLVGGNYGLLNTTTFVPNPDYYSALLWHRLMGRQVLSTKFGGTRKIRAYAHCAKQSKGITLLLINLDGNTTVEAKLKIFTGKYWLKPQPNTIREEYHLRPTNGNIQSRSVVLNGKKLTVDSSTGAIPVLQPNRAITSSRAIKVDPYSILFVHMPNLALPACIGS